MVIGNNLEPLPPAKIIPLYFFYFPILLNLFDFNQAPTILDGLYTNQLFFLIQS